MSYTVKFGVHEGESRDLGEAVARLLEDVTNNGSPEEKWDIQAQIEAWEQMAGLRCIRFNDPEIEAKRVKRLDESMVSLRLEP